MLEAEEKTSFIHYELQGVKDITSIKQKRIGCYKNRKYWKSKKEFLKINIMITGIKNP